MQRSREMRVETTAMGDTTTGDTTGIRGNGTAHGLFAADSITRRVNREAVLLLGGPRALLMQLAHPLVAAGVAAHSDFQRDPLARLRRTLDAMLGIVFETRPAALARARAIDAVHARVRGVLTEGTACFPAGTAYDARDPALLLWVHATLVDSALRTYECFVEPLTSAERARFYDEATVVADLLGIPATAMPRTYEEFVHYVQTMIAGPVLEVTPTAHRLAQAVLHPPIAWVPRPFHDVGRVVTAALLPPPLRRRYGLGERAWEAYAWGAARATIRNVLPWLPDVVRSMPQARPRSEA